MQRSINYGDDFFKYFFSNTTPEGLFDNTAQPDSWAITIHENANDPNGVTLDSTWYSDPLKRKTKGDITVWAAISGSYSNGVETTGVIDVDDHVPQSETWNIDHFIIWALDGATPYPMYTGSFASTITLNEYELLLINTLTIS